MNSILSFMFSVVGRLKSKVVAFDDLNFAKAFPVPPTLDNAYLLSLYPKN